MGVSHSQYLPCAKHRVRVRRWWLGPSDHPAIIHPVRTLEMRATKQARIWPATLTTECTGRQSKIDRPKRATHQQFCAFFGFACGPRKASPPTGNGARGCNADVISTTWNYEKCSSIAVKRWRGDTGTLFDGLHFM